jgi:hypothetical protein
VRINPGTIGGAPLQNIQPESIERIEIVKGARSSLYGTDAIGGVINIITRAGAAPAPHVCFLPALRTQVVAATPAACWATLRRRASYAYQRSDGFPPVEAAMTRDYNNQSANANCATSPASADFARATVACFRKIFVPSSARRDEDFLDASYASVRMARRRDAHEAHGQPRHSRD